MRGVSVAVQNSFSQVLLQSSHPCRNASASSAALMPSLAATHAWRRCDQTSPAANTPGRDVL